MDGTLQNRINPHTSKNSFDITNAKVRGPNKTIDGNDPNKTSFKDLVIKDLCFMTTVPWHARKKQGLQTFKI